MNASAEQPVEEKHEKTSGIESNAPWLEANPNIIDFSQRFPSLRSGGATIPQGIEVAHIMIKPECFQIIPQSKQAMFIETMYRLMKESDLIVSDPYICRLKPEHVELIYATELTNGVFPQDRIDSFTTLPSGHIVAIGPYARLVTTIIKGRVSCHGRNCFVRHIPEDPDFIPPNINRNCPPDGHSGGVVWGRGCGIRLDLVEGGYIQPDLERPHDATWNMVHAATPRENYPPLLTAILNSYPEGEIFNLRDIYGQ